MKIKDRTVHVYTDGSCNPQYNVGGWAAVILFNDQEFLIKGEILGTTHNVMEIWAAIEALKYVVKNLHNWEKINIYSDSQYVVGIPDRKEKLKGDDFKTKKGHAVRNADILETLIKYIEFYQIDFIKVKAHDKNDTGNNYNRKVDKLSRKIVRQCVKKSFPEN